jgi:hypothetical protein
MNNLDWGDKPILWKVWYVIDNKVVTYEGQSEAEFRALPEDGFQGMVVAFPDATLRRISGCDYYWTDTGVDGRPIYAQSSPGQTLDEIRKRYPNASIKFGKHTDDLTILQIEKEMGNFEPYAVEITVTVY